MEVQVDPKVEELTRVQHKLLIDGEEVEAASAKAFETINQLDYDSFNSLAPSRKRTFKRTISPYYWVLSRPLGRRFLSIPNRLEQQGVYSQ